MLVWFATLAAYVLLALAEELHLSETFGESYAEYREKTPFLIPFMGTKSRLGDIAVSVVVPVALLWALILLNRIWD